MNRNCDLRVFAAFWAKANETRETKITDRMRYFFMRLYFIFRVFVCWLSIIGSDFFAFFQVTCKYFELNTAAALVICRVYGAHIFISQKAGYAISLKFSADDLGQHRVVKSFKSYNIIVFTHLEVLIICKSKNEDFFYLIWDNYEPHRPYISHLDSTAIAQGG